MTTANKTALVLGATGGIGGEVARQLQRAGWQVKALVRDRSRVAARRDGIAWIEGDAMNAADVLRAAQGASAIVHAVNPPGYQRWGELVLPMIDNTIAAARAVGARIVLPGTVYNFGPDAGEVLAEDAPQHPHTSKGQIRVELERRLQGAAAQGVRSLVVRAGDFFGPQPGNSWFSQGMVKAGKPVGTILCPSREGVGHTWAYLPDVARTMVLLLERDATLPAFARFHMAGHWDANGRELAASVQRVVRAATGRTPRAMGFPWFVLTLLTPVLRFAREMREMRDLWLSRALRMDNARLVAELGFEPHTPLDEAVAAALRGQGSLPEVPAPDRPVAQRA
ncbi:MAG TPA: NAD(P)H-binding protein [Rhizobacter sp.]|nr:NAD(P)H-binding protein [Rhizobacter sp.]